MKKVVTEIDQLMWAVAENPNPQALDEFGDRYPEHRMELLRRVEMVRGLRQEAKGPAFKQREIPRFEPKPLAPPGIPRGMTVAVALAFAAIAFAGFTAFNASQQSKLKPILVQPIADGSLIKPDVVYTNPPQEPPPTAPVQTPPKDIQSTPISSDEQKKNLNLKDVDLVAALSLITAGTHLKLEIGPGFVNQKVTLSFQDMTAQQMLVKMSKEYAFTVSDEGNGKMLVLPVPDSEQSGTPTFENSRRIGP